MSSSSVPARLRTALLLSVIATVAAVAARLAVQDDIVRDGQGSAGALAAVPVLLAVTATLGLLHDARRDGRAGEALAKAMTALLALFYLLTGFSVGIVFVPALVLMAAAIVIATPPDA